MYFPDGRLQLGFLSNLLYSNANTFICLSLHTQKYIYTYKIYVYINLFFIKNYGILMEILIVLHKRAYVNVFRKIKRHLLFSSLFLSKLINI